VRPPEKKSRRRHAEKSIHGRLHTTVRYFREVRLSFATRRLWPGRAVAHPGEELLRFGAAVPAKASVGE